MKLLLNIIFLSLVVLLVSTGNNVFARSKFAARQDPSNRTRRQAPIQTESKSPTNNAQSKAKDTVASEKVEYKAKDSTRVDKEKEIVYLYGEARVIYQGFELDADYIEFNTKTNLVFARGRTNSKGKYIGRPILKMEGQGTSKADSLRYNIKSGAGNIFGVFTEQEGGYFSGGKAKKQPDDEIHSKGQTYSTCNLPHPHFGIYITKGIVTAHQIITGPVYLKIEDIPLPLGLPFAFFPKPNKKTSGFILPSPGEDYTRGFFLRDGGYYLGLNDYWDAKMTGTIYTRGSYDASLLSNYIKRYKYVGNINLRYSNARYGLEGTPGYAPKKDFNIQWTHSQNANAKPGTTFSASVDAGTSSYNQNTAGGSSYDYNQFAKNTLRSSIAYGRVFDNGINLSTDFSGYQETATRSVSLTLPNISLSVPTFSPFDSKSRLGEQKWYQKLTVGYSMQASNSITSREDLLFKRESLKKFKNGISHQIPVSLAFTALFFNFTANTSYQERWYFQSIEKTYLRVVNSSDIIITDTIPGFKRNGEYNVGMGLSTKIYSTAQFTKFGNFKALRHVMTPRASLTYTPDFSDLKRGYYKEAKYSDKSRVLGPDGKPVLYSIFEGSTYGGPGLGRNATISFGVDNTVEAKIVSPKDTTGKGEKKLPIIQGLGISGSYNLLAKRYKLSTLGFNGRSQFTDKLGINYYGTLDPYQVRDSLVNNVVVKGSNGLPIRLLEDRYTWQNGKLPRLTNFGFSFDYSLNPEALKRKNLNEADLRTDIAKKGAMTKEQSDELAKVSRDPNAFVDFNIPWNFAFGYTFNYTTDRTGLNSNVTNTLNFNGDANITRNWKVQFNSGWDFKASTFSQTSLAIYRDLHCWDMSVSWIPFGAYQFYSVDIKVKAAVLQDLKLSKRKNYYTRF